MFKLALFEVVLLTLCACGLSVPLDRRDTSPELGNSEARPGLVEVDVEIDGAKPKSWSRFPQGTQWANLAWEFKRDDVRHADVVDVDLFDASADTVRDHQKNGRLVICYTSAGTLEKWRPDADEVPKSLLGFEWSAKSRETWFDIRKWKQLKGLMSNRMSLASDKNCDAVEFDNVDCYLNAKKCVKNGNRNELRNYEIEYSKWLAQEAHRKGLAAGFKNTVDLVKEMAPHFDFAISESCAKYNECRYYQVFKDVNKAVFGVEYDKNMYNEACRQAREYGIAMKVADGEKWRTCNVNRSGLDVYLPQN